MKGKRYSQRCIGSVPNTEMFFRADPESQDFGQAGLTQRISYCMAALSRNLTVA